MKSWKKWSIFSLEKNVKEITWNIEQNEILKIQIYSRLIY